MHPIHRRLTRRSALRTLALGGAALVVSPVLASCGQPASTPSGSGDTPPPANPTAASSGQQPAGQATQPPASSSAQLSFWAYNYNPHVQEWTALLEIFHQQNPSTQIKLEAMPDIVAKIAAGFAAGSAGDIVTVHGKSGQRFIRAQVLEPFPQDFSAAMINDFFDGVLTCYVDKGKVYGVPMANNTPGIGMVVSIDDFEEANIPVPERFESWDQVFTIAKELTKTDPSGIITRAGLNTRMGHNIQYVMGAMLEQGKEYFDEQAGAFSINSPEGLNGLKLFHDAVFTHKVDAPEIPVASKSVAQGISSMGMVFIDYIPLTRIEYPDKRFTFVIKPPYAGETPIVVGEGAWGAQVNAQGTSKDQAMEFMQFLASRDTQLHWVKSQTALPALKELTEDPWYETPENAFLKNALATLSDSRFMGNVGDIGKIQASIWQPVMQDLAAGQITVEEAAVRLDDECKMQLEEFKASEGKL